MPSACKILNQETEFQNKIKEIFFKNIRIAIHTKCEYKVLKNQRQNQVSLLAEPEVMYY